MKVKIPAKRVDPEYFQVDLTEWNLEATEALEKFSSDLKGKVLLAASEAIEIALNEGVFVSFENLYDDYDEDGMNDIILEVSIPLGYDCSDPGFKVSFNEIIDDLPACYLSRLANGLRKLVDRIDGKMKKPE